MGQSGLDLDWTEGALAKGLRLYDAGKFFAAHEEWETVWLRAQEPEKTFLQGLIQVTAAFHHLQCNNLEGTSRLLQAALRRLDPYPEKFGGIAVGQLREEIRHRLRALEPPSAQLAPVRIQTL